MDNEFIPLVKYRSGRPSFRHLARKDGIRLTTAQLRYHRGLQLAEWDEFVTHVTMTLTPLERRAAEREIRASLHAQQSPDVGEILDELAKDRLLPCTPSTAQFLDQAPEGNGYGLTHVNGCEVCWPKRLREHAVLEVAHDMLCAGYACDGDWNVCVNRCYGFDTLTPVVSVVMDALEADGVRLSLSEWRRLGPLFSLLDPIEESDQRHPRVDDLLPDCGCTRCDCGCGCATWWHNIHHRCTCRGCHTGGCDEGYEWILNERLRYRKNLWRYYREPHGSWRETWRALGRESLKTEMRNPISPEDVSRWVASGQYRCGRCGGWLYASTDGYHHGWGDSCDIGSYRIDAPPIRPPRMVNQPSVSPA